MGTANSKDGNAKQQQGNTHIKPGGLAALVHNLPGPLSLKEYKSRLATSDGAQTLYFPQSALKVKYAFVSLRGLYPSAPDKPNQDSLCVHTHYGGDPESAFFGIFDGHGEFGTECSQFAKDKVPENLLNSPHILVQPEKAFRQAMVHTNKQLHRQPKDDVDDSMSGTTAISLLLRNRMAYVANVGDSRAVLAEWQGKQLVAQDLSFDQTPFRRDECERVKKCGARVLTLDQLEGSKDPNIEYWGTEDDNDGDPPRLWSNNASYPGTAFTRSIGDRVAEAIGVTAEPEVLTMELTPAHPFLVLASDGVWEFLPSQEVIDIVSRFEDPHEACISVVTESYRLWLEHETRTDDISMILVQFEAWEPDLSTMDPMRDASFSGAYSGSSAMATAGMSGSPFTPEPSSASWYGPMQPPHMHPQLSSLSGTSFTATPMGSAAAAAAAAATATAAPRTSSASSAGSKQNMRNSFSAAPATANGAHPMASMMKRTHSTSAFAAVQTQQQQQQQQQQSSQALANAIILNESVALKRTLEVEVEQQHQLRASMNGVRTIYPYYPFRASPQFLETGELANGPLQSWYANSSDGSSKAGLYPTCPIRFSLEASTASSFLFRGLSSREKAAVFQAFQQVPTKAGQLVIRQGGPGDHFYVVQSGIFDVYLQQEPGQTPLLVHSYEAAETSLPASSSLPYFGELALLYRRPRPASVVARTDGVLLSLHRNDYKACLQQGLRPADGRDVAALVNTLHQVEVLSCLTGTQLRVLAEAMEEATFEDRQLIIQQGQDGQHFFVIQSGEVVCTARRDCRNMLEQPKEVLRVRAGQYFGERALLASSSRRAASAHACGRVVVYTVSRQMFEQALGATLQAFIDAHAARQAQLVVHQQQLALENARMLGARDSLALEDLTAQGLILSTDCSALMLMEHRATEEIYTVWLTSVADVVIKGRQALLLRARNIVRDMEPSFFVPGVLKTFQNCRAMAWVLTSVGLCTLDMLLASGPLDELSAVFVAASVVLGLEHLHHSHIIYRGLSSRTIVVTEAGHLQLVDLRFARKDNDGRCFTLCGDPEYLAPEMVESRSHTAAVDLWALGVLIYCMLSGSTPFATPEDDELLVYRKLCSRSLSWPPHLSPHARSLIDGLLQLQPSSRLGSGPGSFAMLKQHPWFAPVDWDALTQLRLPPPPGMLQRIDDFEGVAYARFEPPPYDGDLSWLEDF